MSLQKLSVYNIIQSDAALTPTSGDILFEKIIEAIGDGNKIVIDFEKVNYINTAFLNAAIGQLFNKYSREQLNNFVLFENISDTDLLLLKKVLVRAKEYFEDKRKSENRNSNFIDE